MEAEISQSGGMESKFSLREGPIRPHPMDLQINESETRKIRGLDLNRVEEQSEPTNRREVPALIPSILPLQRPQAEESPRPEMDLYIKQSYTHPKFLHSNSTSHVWAFGAIAELIDNATDPDVRAKTFYIDLQEKPVPHFTFIDNGQGMVPDKLHKMLSFGYCEKVEVNGHKPIGHYGNGFKSGSMRLGKDALVFTKNLDTMSVGFLSQTFLEAINATTVLVPMVTWNHRQLMLGEGGAQSLKIITQYSMFKTELEVLNQFKNIEITGTLIVIFNLRQEGNQLEFDIQSDPKDIQIRGDVVTSAEGLPQGKTMTKRYTRDKSSAGDVPLDYSLREYCAVLYLKPKMQIYIRGFKVKTKLVAKSLSQIVTDDYKPAGWMSVQPCKITYGINTQNKNVYGMMMYHRNRLIKPYVKLGIQLQANGGGRSVVGVIEADFLQPTHNKQDFDYTPNYRACMTKLETGLKTYWRDLKSKNQQGNTMQEEFFEIKGAERPDQEWVQCDKCLKWRKLPPEVDPKTLPDKWYCYQNKDPRFASCDVEEEKDDPGIQPSATLSSVRRKQKLMDTKEQIQKKLEQERREKEEAARRNEEERRRQHLEEENKRFRREQEEVQLRLKAQQQKERELAQKEAAMKERERQIQMEIQVKHESSSASEMQEWLRTETNNLQRKRNPEVSENSPSKKSRIAESNSDESNSDSDSDTSQQIHSSTLHTSERLPPSSQMMSQSRVATPNAPMRPITQSQVINPPGTRPNPAMSQSPVQQQQHPSQPLPAQPLSPVMQPLSPMQQSMGVPHMQPSAIAVNVNRATIPENVEQLLAAHQQLEQQLTQQLAQSQTSNQQTVNLLGNVSQKFLELLRMVSPDYQFPNPVTAGILASLEMTPFVSSVGSTVSQLANKSVALDTRTQQLEAARRELTEKNGELANLRHLVKRLFVLLRSDSSEVPINSDSEVDKLFAEWVERQESKKKGTGK